MRDVVRSGSVKYVKFVEMLATVAACSEPSLNAFRSTFKMIPRHRLPIACILLLSLGMGLAVLPPSVGQSTPPPPTIIQGIVSDQTNGAVIAGALLKWNDLTPSRNRVTAAPMPIKRCWLRIQSVNRVFALTLTL